MRKLVELCKDDLFKHISPVDYSFRLEKWGTICGIEFELSKELQANLGVDNKTSLTAWVNVTGSCALDVEQIYIASGNCSNQLEYDLNTVSWDMDVIVDECLKYFIELLAFTRYAILLKLDTDDVLEIIRRTLNSNCFVQSNLTFFNKNFKELRDRGFSHINLDNIDWDYSYDIFNTDSTFSFDEVNVFDEVTTYTDEEEYVADDKYDEVIYTDNEEYVADDKDIEEFD